MGCRARFGVSTCSLGCRCLRVLCPVDLTRGSCRALFVGDDWAEDHHDIEIEEENGRRLARARLPEGLGGISRFHALVAEHGSVEGDELAEPMTGDVVVGIETDRGRWVTVLRTAGYQVYAINPLSAARYRERHWYVGCEERRR